MHRNSEGKWVVVGEVPQKISMVIASRDARDFFQAVLIDSAGGYGGMMYGLPVEERTLFDALSSIITDDVDDVTAVREANRARGTSLTVAHFRKWLPELMREFGRATREE